MTITFAVTWDYRCPFARNANEHILAGLASGADWNVTFLPFSLGQAHVEDGQPSVWEQPDQDSGILALQAGVIVRDEFPEQFRAFHGPMFAARHDHARQLSDRAVVADVLTTAGIPSDAVFAAIDSGDALKRVQTEHEQWVESHGVWGVPTFISGEQAVFVRLMDRPGDDPAPSIRAIERVVDLLSGWPELNEFKHTRLPR